MLICFVLKLGPLCKVDSVVYKRLQNTMYQVDTSLTTVVYICLGK